MTGVLRYTKTTLHPHIKFMWEQRWEKKCPKLEKRMSLKGEEKLKEKEGDAG